jgi:phage tail-like protein
MKRDEIALLLPEIFRRTFKQNEKGNVLSALLGVMECLQDPDEAILEGLDHYFDPDLVPADKRGEFLPFLARWVDLDWVLPPSGKYEAGLLCLHDLILAAPRLASVRGTRRGLEQLLEIATGISGYRVEEDPDLPFQIAIHCPPVPEQMRPLVKRIANGEKPAYVKCKLIFQEQDLPDSSPQS